MERAKGEEESGMQRYLDIANALEDPSSRDG